MRDTLIKKGNDSHSSFVPQAKILRVFELMAKLENGSYTVKELSQLFDQSQRTIYRYIDLLKALQLPIVEDDKKRLTLLVKETTQRPSLFTQQKAAILKQLVETGAPQVLHRDALLKKLSAQSEPTHAAHLYLKSRLSKLAETVAIAIRLQQQLVLQGYHSANSKKISDRLIEPFAFGDNYETIHAFDTVDKKNKFFKLERCSSILTTTKPWRNSNLHQLQTEDCFGLSGEYTTWVTLQLGLRAYLLLVEEYPKALAYIQVDVLDDGQKQYLFHCPVYSFEGLARFVLGMCEEVIVIEPISFIAFLKDKLKSATLFSKKIKNTSQLTQVGIQHLVNSHPL